MRFADRWKCLFSRSLCVFSAGFQEQKPSRTPVGLGRVERWRGGVGFGIIPFQGFPVGVSLAAYRAPFPPPARRTGRADLQHPALGRTSPSGPRSLLGTRSSPDRKVASGTLGILWLLGRSQSHSPCPFRQRARTEAPLLRRHYPASTLLRASPSPTRPDLALAGLSVAACLPPSTIGFPCFLHVPSMHAAALYPGGPARCVHRCLPLSRWPSPSYCRVGVHVTLFEASSSVHLCYGLHLRGITIRDPFHRRLRRLRCLRRRFDCYWASDPSQAGLSPAETHKHSRRTVGRQ